MIHLNFEDRVVIETLIRKDYSLKAISEYLNKDTTTIYREIKNRRTLINDRAILNCPKTDKFPFVCNDCKKKSYCKYKKYNYFARNAELNYQTKLKNSRRGIDLTEDELEFLNNLLFKKIAHDNQSMYHFLKTYKDEIPVAPSTIYRYLNYGFFSSFSSEYMHRMLSFKPRKKSKEELVIKVDPKYRIRRKFKDYNRYLKNNPNASIVEIDLVIGSFEDKHALLTMLFKNSKLMLIFKVLKYKPSNMVEVFDSLKQTLGTKKFSEMFEVILTDNGVEFCTPLDIEIDKNSGEILSNLFYCDPNRSNQKGTLERNHEFIRYIIPKGLSFDDLNKNSVINMQNHINNTIRKSLNDSTPYCLFKEQYGDALCKKLNLRYIPAKDVSLSYRILK